MTRMFTITALALAACSTPPLALALQVTHGSTDSCGGTTCSDVHMACESVASIRILDPNQPLAPYISMCQPVVPDKDNDLCSLGSINLDPQNPLPIQTLEVEVVVFPRADVIDPSSGDIVCPANVSFDGVDGFPTGPVEIPNVADPSTTHTVRPAVGGRAFYHPGDSQVVVELGCTDLAALNDPSCAGNNTIKVSASVVDFVNQLPVPCCAPGSIGDLLRVSVGEPKPSGTEYVLSPTTTRPLDLTTVSPSAVWGADVDLMFGEAACLEILEDVSAATSTLSCKKKTAAEPLTSLIDIPGVRLSKLTLDQILTALGTINMPGALDKGLVVGIVLDFLGQPAPNFTVTPDMPATIKYLSADGLSFGGTKTTGTGIFVSTDANFLTQFTTVGHTTGGQSASPPPAFGGLVDGKVTIVVLQFSQPDVGG